MSKKMSPDLDRPDRRDELALREWVDLVADRFEAAWNTSPPARMADFLGDAAGDRRSALLNELARIDLEYRFRRGEVRSLEDYLPEFPELAGPDGTLPDALVLFARDLRRRFQEANSLADTVNHRAAEAADTSVRVRCPRCAEPVEVTAPPGGAVPCPQCGEACRVDAAPDALPLPRTLGKFQLIEVLGGGAFGTVYKARDAELGRLVAVKLPRATAFSSTEEERRFVQEARSAARLAHPHIVPVHQIAREGSLTCIVSEYIAGQTLADRVREGPVSPGQAAEWVAAVAEALHYAHSQGVIHRDVKPSNILIDPAGKPHVTDFGLARDVGGDVAVTAEGQILGTPAYMSPEQATGQSARVDARSDVYSLGVVLYELLTGECPFRGNVRMLLHQVLNDEPRPPRRLNDRIPRDLETICLKALAKGPGRRYADAGEMAADLKRFVEGRPILARPVGRAERLWRWCRRNRALASASGLAIAALMAVAVVSAVLAVREAAAGRQIRQANEGLEGANRDLRDERTALKAALRKSEQLTAHLALDRGVTQGCQGDFEGAMLWFARGLTHAPDDDADLQWLLRANLAGWRRQLCPTTAQMRRLESGKITVLSGDGRLLLCTDRDSTARVWDLATGRPLGPRLPHQSEIEAAAFRPDNAAVATAENNGVLRLWDFRTGRLLRSSIDAEEIVWCLAFTPDGKRLVAGGRAAGVWSLDTGKLLDPWMAAGDSVHTLALSRDGRILVTTHFSPDARVWDLASGKPAGSPLHHDKDVRSVDVSPDGKLVLTTSWDGPVRLWNVEGGEPRAQTLEHKYCESVRFSHDGKSFATGSDEFAQVWDTATARPLGPALKLGPRAGATTIAFGADDKALVVATDQHAARAWEIGTWKEIGTSPAGPRDFGLNHRGRVTDAVFSGDGRIILTAVNEVNGSYQTAEAQLWDAATGKPLGPPLVHEKVPGFKYSQMIRALALDHDGKTAATGCYDHSARLWDVASGKPLAPPLGHEHAVELVAFSPDGAALITGASTADGLELRRFGARTGEPLGNPITLKEAKLPAVFSRDAKRVLAATDDSATRWWDIATGSPAGPRLAHLDRVTAVAVASDQTTVLTGSNDHTAQLWNSATGERLGPPLRHTDSVRSVAFSPDGRLVATAATPRATGISGTHLWEVKSGRPFGPALHWYASTVCFSPDGRFVLSACGHTGAARVSAVPQPVPGDAERIRAWVEVLTGSSMDELGIVRPLTPDEWLDRQERLQQRGGEPAGTGP